MSPSPPIVIVGCGAEKQHPPSGTVPLVELYTGPLFRARLRYAQALGGPHFILSGYYGLRRPDYPAHWYEHSLTKQPKKDREAWSSGVVSDVQRWIERDRPIVVLASGPYLSWIASLRVSDDSWKRTPYQITVPCEHMGIGQQRQWLTTEARRLELEARPVPTALEVLDRRVPGGGMFPTPQDVDKYVRDERDWDDDLPSFETDAAEVLRDLPTWRDDEPVQMRVGVLRVLLQGEKKCST